LIIKTIKINGFRNLENLELSFSKNRNLVHGMNGAGKTSILEAIFIPTYGKSFLSRKKSELVNHNSEEFSIRLTTDNTICTTQISALYNNRLSLLLNDKKTTIFEINNYLYPVLFSSSDYNLYLENKPHTRKMIDRFIFGVDSLYIRYLLSYNRALKQKNCLLKSSRNSHELRSWNKTLSELCKNIMEIKMTFIHKLDTEIKMKFEKDLSISYKPSLSIDNTIPDLDADSIFDRLEAVKQTELKYRRSMLGPHLDNFDIRLDRQPLRIYSSGEKKINLLMIYIAFIELFKKTKNEYPVFLLDDFDTAIDPGNIDFLVENYPEMQVIATSVNRNTHFDNLIELKKEN
jgi:DNA replication and repair protein RecF